MENVLLCLGHKLETGTITHADNCTLYDNDGNKYLDLESGIWCTNVGHSNRRIEKVITGQVKNITHTGFCYLSPVLQETSLKLTEVTGLTNGKCLFLSSGSEAIEFSMRVARTISDKSRFLTMKDSYLSAYGSANSKSSDQWVLFDWMNKEKIDNIPFEKISAFVFEPGSSSGQVRFPPVEVVREIVDKVRSHGGIIIVDEITTGMGRTGEWFGYNHYNITPDIVVLGKGLGNGYPVSCACLSPEIALKLEQTDFHYGQSHQNDPLGVSIANEVIDIIKEEKLLEKCRKTSERIIKGLLELKSQYPVIKEIRARGLMLVIEFEENKSISYAQTVYSELIKRNIIVVKRPGLEMLRLDPALTIENSEIDHFLKSLEQVLLLLQ